MGTHSMLLAIDKISQAIQEGQVDAPYSVGYLFDTTLNQKKKCFASAEQKLSIEHAPNTDYDMCWPLIPDGVYTAPLHKQGDSGGMTYGAPGAGGGGANVPSQVLAAAGDLAGCGALADDDLPGN